MALHEPPRRKLATYGKSAKRNKAPVRPEYASVFLGDSSSSQTPEIAETVAPALPTRNPPSIAVVTAPKPRVIQKMPPKSSATSTSIFDVPDDEPPTPQPSDIQKMPPKRSAASTSIFDVPDDEPPTPKQRKVAKPLLRTTKATSNVKANVFDLTSSDEEKPTKTVKMDKTTIKSSINTTRILNSPGHKQWEGEKPQEVEPRKRTKLSPKGEVCKSLPTRPLQATITSSTTTMKASKMTVTVSKDTPSSTVPKPRQRPQGQAQKKIEPSTPPKIGVVRSLPQSPTPAQGATPSPQLSDVDMMDVDPHGKYISPKGLKMWKDLLEPESEDIISTRIAGRKPSPRRKSPATNVDKTLFAGISKSSRPGPRKIPKKRLIDFLVEQGSSELSDNDDEQEDSMGDIQTTEDQITFSRAHSLAPVSEILPPSDSQSSQTIGPKFVYGSQRTILAEKDFMQALELEIPTQAPTGRRARRGSIPNLPTLSSFHEEDSEEEEGTGKAIRNIHELRQAGANNRFIDELDDIIERISSTGSAQVSLRRSGLLDLASRLNEKGFARQFRSSGAEDKLFVHLDRETDIIAGFLFVSVLMTIFADGSVPHIIPQLRRHGITKLLLRLLAIEININTISRDRKSNMSKVAQSLLADYVKNLLQMSVWEELKLTFLSPRTIALKCLEKMVRQTREAGNADDIFSKALIEKLFEMLKTASQNDDIIPIHNPAFFLALSALESHSITARSDVWVSEFLPIIADTLQVALSQKLEDFGETQLLILRLALNVTNNNPKAANVFARSPLLAIMGQVIIAKFKKITRFLKEEEFSIVMDHLVLTLGVMINFAEWSTPARIALHNLEGRSDDPLDRMAQLFLDNRERMAEADSVEESQKNVAFGYLSILLGYLALLPQIAERIRKRNPRQNLKPLVSSIEEFIGHHKTVDDLIADADGHNPHSGLTERLENLVQKLEVVV